MLQCIVGIVVSWCVPLCRMRQFTVCGCILVRVATCVMCANIAEQEMRVAQPSSEPARSCPFESSPPSGVGIWCFGHRACIATQWHASKLRASYAHSQRSMCARRRPCSVHIAMMLSTSCTETEEGEEDEFIFFLVVLGDDVDKVEELVIVLIFPP